jgi:carbonic anhydrase/acetyltransferase-like protein (isoleucine patch superfamily)
LPVYALNDLEPTIDPTAYVHPDAVVIGDVHLGPHSSVWPTAVLRGDYNRIEIGARTNVQDGTVIHIATDHPTIVGADCVVGHNAYLEGCVVEDRCLIGSMSVLLHDVVVHRGAVVAAGAVLTRGTVVPELAMAMGVPARIKPGAAREGGQDAAVQRYVDNARAFATGLRRIG